MLCERPYLRPVSERDDDEECPVCHNHGFTRWWNPDAGWEFDPCEICGGIATAGTFLVRVCTTRFQYELRYQTPDMARAKARAERFASLAHNFGLFGSRATHVQVLFCGLGKQSKSAAEVVATVKIPRPSLTPTAA